MTSKRIIGSYSALVMMSIALLVSLNGLQYRILTDLLQVPENRVGNDVGSLGFYDELLTIPLLALWGALSDRIGRRTIYTLGFLFLTIALALSAFPTTLYPTDFRTIFSSLLVFRLVFAIGAAATTAMLTAVLSDITTASNRGMFAAAVGLLAGLGAVFAAFVILSLPGQISPKSLTSLQVTLLVTSGIGALGTLLAYFVFQDPQELVLNPRSIFRNLYSGIREAVKDPEIGIAYVVGFVVKLIVFT